jgi:hypothetical protein
MRLRLVTTVAVTAALLAPAGATAGGFATVGVDPLPTGIGAGKGWDVQLTILQHGRTPLEGITPSVILRRGTTRREFHAHPTGAPGVYAARVVFPSAGSWRYVVDDGFTMTHTFPPVNVRAGGGAKSPVAAAAAPTGGSGGDPDFVLALAVAAVAGLAAALAAAGLRRGPTRTAPEGR